MDSKRNSRMQIRFFRLCLIALFSLMATWLPAQTSSVHAATEYGYLWKIVFDFDSSFDGKMTIEVGPWGNGDLLVVEETSTAVVRCAPVGDVKLIDGAATFQGGYLECSFDIGTLVRQNHGLKPKNPDTYGSIVMRTRALLPTDAPAPLFYHPDATYRLDPIGPGVIDMATDLSNGNGVMGASFSGVNWSDWTVYTSNYVCVSLVACNLTYSAGGTDIAMNNQGNAVTFATGPTNFLIGKDDTGILNGRIDMLLVDPGNFAH